MSDPVGTPYTVTTILQTLEAAVQQGIMPSAMRDVLETGVADSIRLDHLQTLTDRKSYTGKVVLRDSSTGRGWRLHESDHDHAQPDVRQAIDEYMHPEYRHAECDKAFAENRFADACNGCRGLDDRADAGVAGVE